MRRFYFHRGRHYRRRFFKHPDLYRFYAMLDTAAARVTGRHSRFRVWLHTRLQGKRFRQDIDAAGGAETAAFAQRAIEVYGTK